MTERRGGVILWIGYAIAFLICDLPYQTGRYRIAVICYPRQQRGYLNRGQPDAFFTDRSVGNIAFYPGVKI